MRATAFRALVAGILAWIVAAPTASGAPAPPPYITQWGSFGSGDGQFQYMGGVAADAGGNVYVADFGLFPGTVHRVQAFSGSGALRSGARRAPASGSSRTRSA